MRSSLSRLVTTTGGKPHLPLRQTEHSTMSPSPLPSCEDVQISSDLSWEGCFSPSQITKLTDCIDAHVTCHSDAIYRPCYDNVDTLSLQVLTKKIKKKLNMTQSRHRSHVHSHSCPFNPLCSGVPQTRMRQV